VSIIGETLILRRRVSAVSKDGRALDV
jgi:hypothetical protein